MGDLISRQAAIDVVAKALKGTFVEYEDIAEKIINKVPSVQPEIIRCKDCKHWGKRGLCEIWDYYIDNEDFYCGCAKRRAE